MLENQLNHEQIEAKSFEKKRCESTLMVATNALDQSVGAVDTVFFKDVHFIKYKRRLRRGTNNIVKSLALKLLLILIADNGSFKGFYLKESMKE